MRVNIHSHAIPPETLNKAGKYGPSLVDEPGGGWSLKVGPYQSRGSLPQDKRFLDPMLRLKDMDSKRIDIMGVTISPLFYLYWAEPEIGIPFARVQNDALANWCKADPKRLFFIATLPMQDPKASLIEADRAVELGARGFNVGTDNFAGRNLDHQAFFPLYEKIQQLDVPLFIHPYPLPMEGGESDKYNLSWIAGYVHQDTVAFCHLVFGGVLDHFPRLKVCITHGGGSVPYQFGRLEYALARMPDVEAKKPLHDYLENFYFDVLIHDLKARSFLVDFMGADHLVMGDNYLGWDAVDGFALVDELKLPDTDHRKICGDNAVKLFKLG